MSPTSKSRLYKRVESCEDTAVKLVESIGPENLKNATLVADSNEFAIYAIGNDTYALVHRHKAVDWQGITISGDGLFRIAELLTKAMRSLYRDVAGDLSRAGQSEVPQTLEPG